MTETATQARETTARAPRTLDVFVIEFYNGWENSVAHVTTDAVEAQDWARQYVSDYRCIAAPVQLDANTWADRDPNNWSVYARVHRASLCLPDAGHVNAR